ncbi:hypothetical protein F4561_001365 [Lipingzhangella halophila]|uniref:Amidohydrolase 3 domain-containing protein n=1 Tax=Lipingzhangella halophila TaxID=1783352 RepID=A0A7W7REV8_9ACTN|nr:amidohydrolase [Lipingzhangella halophila]MBB4930545.1 hypothetical protein [Lipingzhangella halophila]
MSGGASFALTGARVYTGDPRRPWARSLAVEDGVLTDLGEEPETARTRAGVDLDGAFVMPGFVDVHNHHAVAGRAELFELTFPPEAGVDEILAAVSARAAELPGDAWITGGSWGSGLLDLLNRSETLARLDAASAGRPVALSDDSHHNRWVNSAAMAAAGLESDSEQPDTALRDPVNGTLTGVLLESAGLAVMAAHERAAPLTAAQHEACSAHGVARLNRFGITAFQDAATSLRALEALHALDERDELHAWVVASMPVSDETFGTSPVGAELIARGEEFRTRHHRPDFVKVFLDGVPPARTGAFLEPYLPDAVHGAHHRGETILGPAELYSALSHAAERNLGAKVHCTGDASVRLALDTVARLRREGFADTPFQIAHGQFVAEDDIPRLGDLGVSADISPFLWYPGVIPDAIASVLPAERARRMQPNRSLIDSGALVAGGSDWPVSASPNPWLGIQGLVTRADPTGTVPGALWPEQAITLPEAIAVFTANAAAAMGLGAVTGTLAPGRSADFVVLDRDPFAAPIDTLADTRVLQTWFAGRCVFEAE